MQDRQACGAGVCGHKRIQDRQACGAGVRRGSGDGISIWKVAAFEPVKATHSSPATTSHAPAPDTHPLRTHTRFAHTPARDDHAGVFPFLSCQGSIQLRSIGEYGPAMQA